MDLNVEFEEINNFVLELTKKFNIDAMISLRKIEDDFLFYGSCLAYYLSFKDEDICVGSYDFSNISVIKINIYKEFLKRSEEKI